MQALVRMNKLELHMEFKLEDLKVRNRLGNLDVGDTKMDLNERGYVIVN
jgi:hypothetical protein